MDFNQIIRVNKVKLLVASQLMRGNEDLCTRKYFLVFSAIFPSPRNTPLEVNQPSPPHPNSKELNRMFFALRKTKKPNINTKKAGRTKFLVRPASILSFI
ncbi:hypothetical protein DP120_03450 [Planococcus halotolerans]|uniref:Uncharacterized protein n=1 Tax=Planococcus halotolerans TaxID=2233542 RepID=A0A365L7H9_9BACL|nr:hypothetical protein DP120_03450 [Planococcus halotolerans]